MKIGLYYLFITWIIIIIAMAAADTVPPYNGYGVAYWLILFFIGAVATIWILMLFPITHKEAKNVAGIATLFLAGAFLAIYNITWEICIYLVGFGQVFPVPLYPFPFIVNAFLWYLMIGVGFFAMGLSIYWLSKERFR
jgi:hypothetical protein